MKVSAPCQRVTYSDGKARCRESQTEWGGGVEINSRWCHCPTVFTGARNDFDVYFVVWSIRIRLSTLACNLMSFPTTINFYPHLVGWQLLILKQLIDKNFDSRRWIITIPKFFLLHLSPIFTWIRMQLKWLVCYWGGGALHTWWHHFLQYEVAKSKKHVMGERGERDGGDWAETTPLARKSSDEHTTMRAKPPLCLPLGQRPHLAPLTGNSAPNKPNECQNLNAHTPPHSTLNSISLSYALDSHLMSCKWSGFINV